MLFNSTSFLLFFPIVVGVHFLLPQRFRWMWLLLASCHFYMSFIPAYILILFFLIAVDYAAGILIEDAKGNIRKYYLIGSLVANVGILSFFKYFDFLNANFSALAGFIGWNYPVGALEILLPIGLSFHTFQSIAYTIEVYRRRQKAERNLGIYALYVMFFPQLVAGPIERPQNLIHQFYARHKFDMGRISDGLRLMLWGFFKKIVVADRLAIMVNLIYGNPTEFAGLPLIAATVAFGIQVYCDFSGYSDIAIGAARVLGYELMANFRRPYFSKSIREFWNRWHISLYSWFRDFVYIPMGGSRVSRNRMFFNILIVFLISGAWHGANWTFILWGGLHGSYLVLSYILEKPLEGIANAAGLGSHNKLLAALQITATFCLVSFGWILFRAKDLADAAYIMTHLFAGPLLTTGWVSASMGWLSLGLAGISLSILLAGELIQERMGLSAFLSRKPLLLRLGAYAAIIWCILLFGVFGANTFIYFQF